MLIWETKTKSQLWSHRPLWVLNAEAHYCVPRSSVITNANNGTCVFTMGPSLRQKMGVQGQGDCSFLNEVEMGREVSSRCS